MGLEYILKRLINEIDVPLYTTLQNCISQTSAFCGTQRSPRIARHGLVMRGCRWLSTVPGRNALNSMPDPVRNPISKHQLNCFQTYVENVFVFGCI